MMIAEIATRAAAERIDRLVRRVDGVELPVPGRWSVPEHHATVSFTRPRALGHADSWRGRATEAAVIVGADPSDVTITIRIDAPGLPANLGSRSRASSRSTVGTKPSRQGIPTWPLHGRLSVNGHLLPVEATLAYHGVWRRGERAYGWFVLDGAIEDGARTWRRMRFTFELLAERPIDAAGEASGAA